MVERLRMAIEKARASRTGASASPAAALPDRGPENPAETRSQPSPQDADPWLALEEITLDPRRLVRERVITRDKADRAHIVFDSLRTRLLKALRDNGWWRVVITSPTKGCGKTMVAANLAFSLARQSEVSSMLIDLDLRMPTLAQRLGQRESYAVERYLLGEIPPRDYFRRAGNNLALGLNTVRVRNSAELIQSKRVAATLDATWELYRPHVAIFDMPPMLTCDDVLAFLPNVDCVLLVVGGGESKAADIEECERLLADHTNFLGVLLNKGEERDAQAYLYDEGRV